MKVVLLSATPPPVGGIATWTLRMLNMDASYGCEYILVDEKMIGGRDMFGNNKRSLWLEIKRSINIWRKLKKTIKDSEVDIVQSCIPSSTLSMIREYVCACITKRFKKKYVIHFHSTVPNTRDSFFWEFLLKRITAKSDCVFVLNAQSKEFLKHITLAKIEIVPNFVEGHEIAESHFIKENISTVLYVGGVIESKGALDILKVAELHPDICFRLVGNPETSIAEKAMRLSNVVLTGVKNKAEVQAELRKADVFLFLSKFKGEGFSIALLEAMAEGLPCIVTDWAANKDMIGNEGGFTVTDSRAETVSVALKKMESMEVRQSQSRRNIETVKAKYSASAIFHQYTKLYRDIIDLE